MRLMQREERRRYQEQRAAEVGALNEELKLTIQALDAILVDGLARDPSLDWHTLSQPTTQISDNDRALKLPVVPSLASLSPPDPGLFARFIPGSRARHQRFSLQW